MSEKIKAVIIGSGTSFGVPIPGCDCLVCKSKNKKNKRTRASIYIETKDTKFLIDTSKDLWWQLIKNKISDLDFVLYTHSHADHIFGLDDLRCITARKDKSIDIYGRMETIKAIKKIFNYVFDKAPENYVSKPRLKAHILKDKVVYINNVKIEAVTVDHACMLVNGYIINNKIAYITDVKNISEKIIKKIKNIPILILGCIRQRPHNNHMGIDEAIAVINKIKPKKAYLTHTSHILDYDETNKILPKNVKLGFDGLTMRV